MHFRFVVRNHINEMILTNDLLMHHVLNITPCVAHEMVKEVILRIPPQYVPAIDLVFVSVRGV